MYYYFMQVRPISGDPEKINLAVFIKPVPLLCKLTWAELCKVLTGCGRMRWRVLWLLRQQFKYLLLLSCEMEEFKSGRTLFSGSATLLGPGLNRLAEHSSSTLVSEQGWIQNTCFEKTCRNASTMQKHGKSGIRHEHLAYLFNQGELEAQAVLHVASSSTSWGAPRCLGAHMLVVAAQLDILRIYFFTLGVAVQHAHLGVTQ